jgi:hypothetical protein
MKLELWITGQKGTFMPELVDEVSWTTEEYGAGMLEFKVIKEGSIDFKEGDSLVLTYDGHNLFKGRVFEKSRTQEGIISVTAYDGMRYLKNRDSYTFIGKTAAQIVRMICDDYKLETGSIADTGFVIASRIEDNSTLFDIIHTALRLTKNATGKEYLLYDDFGKISLAPISYFDTNLLADNETSIGFSYRTTIDSEVYNKIKLINTTSKNKVVTETVYEVKDDTKIDEWGLLQYFRHIDENVDGNVLANNLLETYDRKNRKLVVTTIGNYNLRAGSSVHVNLDIGDFLLDDTMRAKKCVHTFSENQHFVALTLKGGQLETK